MEILKRLAHEVYNCDFDKVSRENIMEVLTLYSYLIDDDKRKVEEIRKQNAQLRAKYGLKH